jgi:hypothetical protein
MAKFGAKADSMLFLETFLAREQCEGTLWRQTDLPTLGYSE